MFLVFFLFWLVLNGRVTLEIIIFGLVISAGMYLFCWKFMDYNPRRDLSNLKKVPLIIAYLAVLIKEIIKANIVMAGYIFHPQILAEPALVRFHAQLKSRTCRVILANSITLTPGTITVEMRDGDFLVHCYDKSMGEGIESSAFVRLLQRLEDGNEY